MGTIVNGGIPSTPPDLDSREILYQRLWELCKKCWIKSPSLRPSMRDILADICRYGQGDFTSQDSPLVIQQQMSQPSIDGKDQYPWWRLRSLDIDKVPSQWKTQMSDYAIVYNPYSSTVIPLTLMHEIKFKKTRSYVLY
jgi:hypothetical protein